MQGSSTRRCVSSFFPSCIQSHQLPSLRLRYYWTQIHANLRHVGTFGSTRNPVVKLSRKQNHLGKVSHDAFDARVLPTTASIQEDLQYASMIRCVYCTPSVSAIPLINGTEFSRNQGSKNGQFSTSRPSATGWLEQHQVNSDATCQQFPRYFAAR